MRAARSSTLLLALVLCPLLAVSSCDNRDGDAVPDAGDNCPDVFNSNQADPDGDGVGAACDPDRVVRLLLVRVHTPDGVVAASEAEVMATARDMADWYAENAYGTVRFSGVANPEEPLDQVGPFQVPVSWDGYDESAVTTPVDAQLAASGIDKRDYHQVIYVVPDSFGATTPTGLNGGFANGYDLVWIRARAVTRAGLLAHEIGHNLQPGLGHANLLECAGPEPYDLSYTGCITVEYLDAFDTMGWSEQRGHMSGRHKKRLGFFGPGNVWRVTASGTYWLAPIELHSTGPQLLEVPRSPAETLHLEYRQPIGYDSHVLTSLPGSADGVQIRTDRFGDPTVLIRPGGRFSLAPGRRYDAGTVTVTTVRSDPEVTFVEIDFASD